MSENATEYGRPLVRDEEILKTARKTIASRLPRDIRDQFISGKHDHFQVVQAICDAIEAERERHGWQSIETFDAKTAKGPWTDHVMLGHSENKWIRFGRYDLTLKRWYYSGTNERSQWAQVEGDAPTHWMPLPSPPKP